VREGVVGVIWLIDRSIGPTGTEGEGQRERGMVGGRWREVGA
jgi:hypothetical protein